MPTIRDPIHGAIPLDERERRVVDSAFFQRLRHVRQLGFSELAFPGATHSRYAHALGACHVAGRVFDGFGLVGGTAADRDRLRSAVRVAALLHDCGHAPFSHASEAVMPERATLSLPPWAVSEAGGQATHEDFTLHVILHSELADVLREAYGDLDLPPEAVASLIAGREPDDGGFFVTGGVDHGPLLRQVVSSELDADRMDYLLRDSFYTGVSYGQFDLDWLAASLRAHVHDGVAELALGRRAIFAFEDFLLSRYHMFLSVYYHHTATCFDHLLRAYFRDAPGEFEIPVEPEAFLHCDDVALLGALRRSASPWARRITRRDPFRVLVEANAYDTGYDLQGIGARLAEAGIDHLCTESRGIVSKYFGADTRARPIWVEIPDQRRFVELESYTPLFRRYEEVVCIERIYVAPGQLTAARELLDLSA